MVEQRGVDRFRTGTATGAMRELLAGERARIFYTDPPWGPGMMTYFQNMAEKESGQPVERLTYDVLVRDLYEQAREHTDGPIILEYGTQWHDDIESLAAHCGLVSAGVLTAKYQGGHYHVHLFESPLTRVPVAAKVTEAYRASVAAASTGLRVVKAVIAPWAVDGAILVDLCAGYGTMAKAAKASKMRFYGNELIPTRLARHTG